MKKMNSTSFVFKVWKTRKLKKDFAKEEEEEVQRDSEIKVEKLLSKELLNEYFSNANQSVAFIDSSCLVKRTIRRVITFRKNWKPLEELHLLIFVQNLSLVIDYLIIVIDYTKHFCERMWLFTFEFEFQRSDTLVIDYQYIVIDYTI